MGRGGRGQLAVVAVDEADLLPVGHRVWDVLRLVGELDLSRFEAEYRVDGRGHPPYEPAMMVALIVYCRGKGLSSSREIAAACYDDVGARVITGGRYPAHTAVTRFLRRHAGAVRELLVQTLRLGAAVGLVDVSVVAGDGTKLRANASMDATIEASDLRAQIVGLRARVQALHAVWLRQVSAEIETAGAQSRFGDYLFMPGTLAGVARAQSQAQARASVAAGAGGGGTDRDESTTHDTDAVDDGPGVGAGVNAEDTWRKLRRVQRTLDARVAALAVMTARPGQGMNTWAARVAQCRERLRDTEVRLQATRAQLQAAADRRAGALAAGVRLPGAGPVPVEDHIRVRRLRTVRDKAAARLDTAIAARPTATRINTTDPASRIMPGKRGSGFAQHHNVQALACKNQFILAIATHDNTNDVEALTDLLDDARANLDAAAITDPIKVALFDSGYASDTNFTATVPADTLLIAVSNGTPKTTPTSTDTRNATTTPTSSETTTATGKGTSGGKPKGRTMSGDSPAWNVMAERLNDPTNRTLYKSRSTIIEPLFAQLFNRFGRTLNLRGDNVATELHLWALTHNLLKISRHQRKPHPPG